MDILDLIDRADAIASSKDELSPNECYKVMAYSALASAKLAYNAPGPPVPVAQEK